jgi:hypothetical protein
MSHKINTQWGKPPAASLPPTLPLPSSSPSPSLISLTFMLNWEVTVRLLTLLFGRLHILLHTSASSIAASKEESGSDKLHTTHTTALAYSRLPASAAAKDLLLEALSGYIYMSFYVFLQYFYVFLEYIQKIEREKGEEMQQTLTRRDSIHLINTTF